MKKLIVLMAVLVALAGFTLVALQSGPADAESLDTPAAEKSEKSGSKRGWKS